jgi:hypothetical protein
MAAYLNRQSPDRRGGCHRSDLQPARRCMRQKAGFRLIFWAIAPIFRSFADGVDKSRQSDSIAACARQPGVARNIEILVDPEHLPVLR